VARPRGERPLEGRHLIALNVSDWPDGSIGAPIRPKKCYVKFYCNVEPERPLPTPSCPMRAAASRQAKKRKLSHKRALAPTRHIRIKPLRNKGDGPVTRPLYGKDAYENFSVCYVLRALTLPANDWRTNLGSSFNSAVARESYLP
jgi:hypothetical protein